MGAKTKPLAQTEPNFSIIREVTGWYSAYATTSCPDPLADKLRWPSWPQKDVYAPVSVLESASAFLINRLAQLEPPVLITEEEVFVSVRETGTGMIEVNAMHPLEDSHPAVVETKEALGRTFGWQD